MENRPRMIVELSGRTFRDDLVSEVSELLSPIATAEASVVTAHDAGFVDVVSIGFIFLAAGGLRKFVDGFSEELGKRLAGKIIAGGHSLPEHGQSGASQAVHITVTVLNTNVTNSAICHDSSHQRALSRAIKQCLLDASENAHEERPSHIKPTSRDASTRDRKW